ERVARIVAHSRFARDRVSRIAARSRLARDRGLETRRALPLGARPRLENRRTPVDATSAESSWAWPRGGGRRALFDLQQAARPLPTDARHPRRRRDRHRRAACERRGINIRGIKWSAGLPSREVRTRAPGIDASRRTEMLPKVEQDVDHAHARLPRRR